MRRLGYGLVTLGIGVAAAALLGPLFFGVIEYHVSDDVLNQVMGGDAVALFLIAPVCVFAGVLALRNHRAAPLVGIGPAGFAVYTYAQLAIGGEFATESGNSEMFFPLFLVLFVLGGAVMVMSWNAVGELPRLAMRTTVTVVFLLLGGFLAMGLHLPGLVEVLGGGPGDVGYSQSPTVFWVVKLMDLGIVVPVAVATALGLLRGSAWADKAAYALLGWGAMLGSAVAGMAVVMQINDDPAAVFANVVIMGTFAIAFLGLFVKVLQPLFGSGAPRGPVPDRAGDIAPPTSHLEMGQDSHSRDSALR
jgi:hypothetical protein